MQNIGTCLWFDNQAEEAAKYYSTVFKRTKVGRVARYGEAGAKVSGQKAGTVMTVDFELEGLKITGLNGGPMFKFNPAISLMVNCDSQAEIDHYWARLGEGGDPAAQQCGWLADRYGVSWQITPRDWEAMTTSTNQVGAQRAMKAMMGMKKLDIAQLQAAFNGTA